MHCDAREAIKKVTGARWNKIGMDIDTGEDPMIAFAVRIIAHNFY